MDVSRSAMLHSSWRTHDNCVSYRICPPISRSVGGRDRFGLQPFLNSDETSSGSARMKPVLREAVRREYDVGHKRSVKPASRPRQAQIDLTPIIVERLS
jgi:hypothetical protein